eukprot:TRINITY_DN15477_c0_g1_i1.p1 TRINITY_DN15477_c0_g1~~TRINITY_DN15477_c0_g1_i1.p1  ORF type:complete len:233 (-),score=73.35 TRINITY_DN15477_c0_g1_i1:141-839(-)
MFSFWSGNDDKSHLLEELETPKTSSDYEKIMNDAFEYLENSESKGWVKIDLVDEKYNGIELFELNEGENGIIELKSKTTIKGTTPEEFLKMKMLGYEERKKMETDLLKLNMIEQIDKNIQVVLLHMSAPTPVSSREFVSVRGHKTKEDGTILFASKSINREDVKVESGFVRGVARTGSVFAPVYDENKKIVGTEITNIDKLDPKGWIPTFVINAGKNRPADRLIGWRAYFEN